MITKELDVTLKRIEADLLKLHALQLRQEANIICQRRREFRKESLESTYGEILRSLESCTPITIYNGLL